MSFDDVKMKADQEFSLKQDPDGRVDYALKAAVFPSLTHLTIFFPANFGSDHTRIYYIGLRGEYLSDARQKVTRFCYITKSHKKYYISVNSIFQAVNRFRSSILRLLLRLTRLGHSSRTTKEKSQILYRNMCFDNIKIFLEYLVIFALLCLSVFTLVLFFEGEFSVRERVLI